MRDGWQGGVRVRWRLCDASARLRRVRRGEGELCLWPPLGPGGVNELYRQGS